jgi:D-sedoheptulose 7-phosphate isomerase
MDVKESVSEAVRAIQYLQSPESLLFMERAIEVIALCFERGGKIMIAGNGGSYCDAAHFAEELTGFYRAKRRPLPAMVLGDAGHITCVANDTHFEEVFSRLVESLGKREDLLILLSTSGNSKNLLRAAETAREKGIFVLGFLGKGGGKVKSLTDLAWVVEGFATSDRIQEAHMAGIHIIIEGVEERVADSLLASV